MLTGFDSGSLHCDQTSELSPLTQWASCQAQSILCIMPFWKKERNLKKKNLLLPRSKEKLLCAQAGRAAEQRWMRGWWGWLAAHPRCLPAPWRHFFSSLLPPPPPTILKWLCMSHTPTSKHKAPCISLFHARAIPSITFLFSRDYKNLGLTHKGHTSVHAPTPRPVVWNASCTSIAAKSVPNAGMLHGWGVKNNPLCHSD